MKGIFRKSIFFVLLIVLTFQSTLHVHAQNYVDHHIILKTDVTLSTVANVKKVLQEEFKDLQITQLRQLFPLKNSFSGTLRKGEKSVEKNNLHLIFELTYLNDWPVLELAEQINALDFVAYAQPHYLPELALVPNDPFLSRLQSNYELIQLFEGWGISKGDSNVVIGVVDTGTDPDHPDLIDNLYLNRSDPMNGIDDDHDGYVDNLIGWDFGEHDNDPQSVKSHHGVHMCGLIAATPNNGIGIAGTSYWCRFLPVKIAEDTNGTLIGAYEGLKYAADAGCAIINCSWGSYFVGAFEAEIVDYAVRIKKCLVVGAAGNDDDNQLFYPAAFEGVLAVASTDVNDRKVSNSNYHENVDITAPGERMYATWNEGKYQSSTGTSVATAVVSGIAGILKSSFPTDSNEQLIERMKQTADFIYNDNLEYDGLLGSGRINLYKALNNDLTPNLYPLPFKLFPNPIIPSQGTRLQFFFYLQEEAAVEIELYSTLGDKSTLLEKANFDDGVYQFSIETKEYAAGIYFFCMTRNEHVYCTKLLVQ